MKLCSSDNHYEGRYLSQTPVDQLQRQLEVITSQHGMVHNQELVYQPGKKIGYEHLLLKLSVSPIN